MRCRHGLLPSGGLWLLGYGLLVSACTLTSNEDELTAGTRTEPNDSGDSDGPRESGNPGSTDASPEREGDSPRLEAATDSSLDVGPDTPIESADSRLDTLAERGPDAPGDALETSTTSDAPCPAGHKRCGDGCSPLDESKTGCAAASCEPCKFAFAQALCVAGQCTIGNCDPGFDDCNQVEADGCEASLLTDIRHCGNCATKCAFQNADAVCVNGTCGPGGCWAGYEDCDKNKATNGCETSIDSDPANCAACGSPCPDVQPGKHAVCLDSVCGYSACELPLADCDQDPSEVCETDTQSAVSDCGSCSHMCSFSNAQAKCELGVCHIASCDTDRDNCDGSEATGCETDTSVSTEHCGGCNQPCSGGANAQPVCNASTCALGCNAGYGDCDKVIDNGCEQNLNTSNAHCGACSKPCTVGANAAPSCKAGVCTAVCSTGYGDCDKSLANGCERVFATDPLHCGTCNHSCLGGTCVAGKCQPLTLISAAGMPFGIAVGSASVFWTDSDALSGTSVWSIPKTGGTKVPIGTGRYPWGIAVDTTRAYWTNSGDGSVNSALLAGGSQTVVDPGGPSGATGIALSTTAVYWANETSGEIQLAPKATGSPTLVALASGNPSFVETDSAYVYWSTEKGIYRHAFTDPTIGALTIVSDSTPKSGFGDFAVQGTSVYFARMGSSGTIAKVPVIGGTETTLATSQSYPLGVAADSAYVYWTNQGSTNGAIMRAPLTGGTATSLATVTESPANIVVDSTAIYWTVPETGSVVRLAK